MATSRNNELTWDLGWFALRGSDGDIEQAGEMLRKVIDRIAIDDIETVQVAPGVSEIRYQMWSFRLKKDDLRKLLQTLPNIKLRGIAQGRHVYEEVYSRAGSSDWVSVEFLKDYPSDDLPAYRWWDKDGLFELARNTDGTYCIAAFYRWDEEIEIPSEIDGVAVTAIGDKAFYRNTHIKRLAIPDSVTSIGKSAFSGCSNLIVQTANPEVRTALEKAKVNVTSGNESEEDLEFKANYSYRKTKEGIVITKYRGDATEVSIPGTVEGLPVVQIGKEAFDRGARDSLGITKVSIPASVVSIGSGAFFCPKLTDIEFESGSRLESIGADAFNACRIQEIKLPDGLKEIGESAFWACPLKSIRIPASVENIGADAFGNEGDMAWPQPVYSWTDPDDENASLVLECIEVDEGNESYASVDGALYSKDLSRLIRVPVTVTGAYAVPEGVVDIEAHAFEGCHVENVIVPATVRRIGGHAFMSCRELKEVEFGDGSVLEDIGEMAFYECSKLGGCSIPASVKRLAANVFERCGSLREVSVKPGSELESIGEEAFANSTALNTVDLGHASKLTSVSASAFSNIWPYVVFPPSLTKFEKWFGDGVIAQADVFAPGIACSAIRQLDYKKNCVAGFVRGSMEGRDVSAQIAKGYRTYIKGHAEEVLVRFRFDLDVLKWLIGQKILSTKDTGHLAQVATERGLAEQAAVLLEYSDSATTRRPRSAGLELDEGLDAVEKLPTVAELKKTWKVKKVGSAYTLTSWLGDSTIAEVPDHIGKFKVTTIGDRAFAADRGAPNYAVRKSQLEEIRLPEGVRSIGSSCFAGCESLKTVVLPSGLRSIGYVAFKGCDSLGSIDLPDSVWSIENGAFAGLKLSALTIRAKGSIYIGKANAEYNGELVVDEYRFCDTEVCDTFFESYGWEIAKRVCLPSFMPEEQREEYAAKKNEFLAKLMGSAAKYGLVSKYHPVEFGVWED